MSVVINSDRLDREMARRGWTSADLARQSGLSAASISHARHGHAVSASTVSAIAKALAGTPPIDHVDDLLL